MTKDIKLIYSPLAQQYQSKDQSVEIFIYRSEDSGWVLEVEDGFGNSTVWDEEFVTDKEALDCAIQSIKKFCGSATVLH